MQQKQPNKVHGKFFSARLTSIISISLMLFVLGLIAFLGILAKEISTFVKENIGFTVVVADEISKQDLNKLKLEFTKAPYVKSFEFISKEQALEELTTELGENPQEFLGFNPLQASYEVKLHSAYANNDSIAKIEKKVKAITGSISDFNYRKEIVQLVNDNMRKAGGVLLGLAIVLLIISFSLINNTVRLGVYARRFLIHTMKLVGATGWFICKPFLWSNIVNGIISSFIAMGLLYGLIAYLNEEFGGLRMILKPELLLTVFGIVLAMGITITAIAAFFAINRYIRMKADDMYLV